MSNKAATDKELRLWRSLDPRPKSWSDVSVEKMLVRIADLKKENDTLKKSYHDLSGETNTRIEDLEDKAWLR